MIPELGHFALILATVVAVVQGTLPFAGAARGDVGLMSLARVAACVQAGIRLVQICVEHAAEIRMIKEDLMRNLYQ